MARTLTQLPKDIAIICHAALGAYSQQILNRPVYTPWGDLSVALRRSAVGAVFMVLEGRSPAELHASWRTARESDGWILGPVRDEQQKIHPNLIPYDELPEGEKEKDRLYVSIVSSFIKDDELPEPEKQMKFEFYSAKNPPE